MAYEEIDGVLKDWARMNNVHLYTKYKDAEVRSFEVSESHGQRFQIWVDPPDSEQRIDVHVWDYKKRREDISTSVDSLSETLDRARKVISDWSG